MSEAERHLAERGVDIVLLDLGLPDAANGPSSAESAGSSRPACPGVRVAFRAPDRAAVDRFHTSGLDAGARDDGRPGLRTAYGPKYYAAFLLDPDGNNVEAVCLL